MLGNVWPLASILWGPGLLPIRQWRASKGSYRFFLLRRPPPDRLRCNLAPAISHEEFDIGRFKSNDYTNPCVDGPCVDGSASRGENRPGRR